MTMTYTADWDTDYSVIEPDRKFPLVVKIKRYSKELLLSMQKHAELVKRLTLAHCDPERFAMNAVHRGQGDWAYRELEQIKIASVLNMQNEAQRLRERGRRKEADRVLFMGPQTPWKQAKHGPVVEIIISAHHKYFLKRTPEGGYVLDADGNPVRDEKKGKEFLERARQILSEQFGMSIVHMRSDRDEMADHMHCIVIDWTVKETKTKGVQRMITPTKHPLLKTWEKAQTEFAKRFEDMGIVRARDIARQRREAAALGEQLPEKPKTQSTYLWRQKQKALAEAAERKRIQGEKKSAEIRANIARLTKQKEDEVNALIAEAKAQAAKEFEKVERAKKEAEEKQRKADKALASSERNRARVWRSWNKLRQRARDIRSREDKVSNVFGFLRKAAAFIVPLIGAEKQRQFNEAVAAKAKQIEIEVSKNPTIPGTLLIPDIGEFNLQELDEQLKAMSNREVRARAIISKDAAEFVESGAERYQAKRGWLALAQEAEFRGIDIFTGQIDASKAKNKLRAALHSDVPNETVLEIREEIV
ncbi:hypothetical protein, partial [Celeribacter sp. PS-C1]|uniref:hypothetical protein n=1 Tax=Celeribacter sp. PS-C1 TaxID=2820813 RepID=UPI001CA5EC51